MTHTKPAADLTALSDEALARETESARGNLRALSRRGASKAIDAALERVRALDAEARRREEAAK